MLPICQELTRTIISSKQPSGSLGFLGLLAGGAATSNHRLVDCSSFDVLFRSFDSSFELLLYSQQISGM